jgi:hypothetical protein
MAVSTRQQAAQQQRSTRSTKWTDGKNVDTIRCSSPFSFHSGWVYFDKLARAIRFFVC